MTSPSDYARRRRATRDRWLGVAGVVVLLALLILLLRGRSPYSGETYWHDGGRTFVLILVGGGLCGWGLWTWNAKRNARRMKR